MSNHTPTPWKVVSNKNEGTADPLDRTICILDLGGALIASMNENELDASGIENAALIVRAVNCHEALVSQLIQHHEDSVDPDHFERLASGDMGCTTCALIAKVEGA